VSGFKLPAAREWLVASERAVSEPQHVSLPFEAAGRFDTESPEALGYRFDARSGWRIAIEIDSSDARGDGFFVDLFVTEGGRPLHVRSTPPSPWSSESGKQRIELPVLETDDYVLRVQPALGQAGAYKVRIESAPLLAFPVQGVGARAIRSGFGAERDGGARAHRGVDIFAARGTPALAALDAWVSRVESTPRGGNVVWLQPLFGNMRLYYAHLDTQLVQPGDFVLAGEPVGTVGNTGNARTTPPHLHFGVYLRQRGVRGGARDPYPFLD
jgi:murein DD-endopeptidase MepM/ murein hydrolase activator NlpD